jgi:hypothetical protein
LIVNLPFKKKKEEEPAVTAKTPLGQIRQLYSHYQKQANQWGYTLLSSLALICIWVVFSIFRGVNWSYLSLPLLGIVFSAMQMRRIKGISRILRQAHEVQQEIEKAEAEKKAREEAEAAKNGKQPKAAANGASGGKEEEGQ